MVIQLFLQRNKLSFKAFKKCCHLLNAPNNSKVYKTHQLRKHNKKHPFKNDPKIYNSYVVHYQLSLAKRHVTFLAKYHYIFSNISPTKHLTYM